METGAAVAEWESVDIYGRKCVPAIVVDMNAIAPKSCDLSSQKVKMLSFDSQT
jgi:hypothetical protein